MFAFAGPVEQPVLRDGGHIVIYYNIYYNTFCWPVEQSASLISEMEDTYIMINIDMIMIYIIRYIVIYFAGLLSSKPACPQRWRTHIL